MNYKYPDKNGYFGTYGGAYVDNHLKNALKEIETAFFEHVHTSKFQKQFHGILKDYIGRQTPLYFAEKLTSFCSGAKIYLKREDLNHTGAHKINNALGQVLLALQMGKKRIVAETGAGQHGVATATVCARFSLPCTIYMGEKDMKRQASNVFKMKVLGAKVVPVSHGQKTLKEAVDKALEDFSTHHHNTFYLLGSAVGPHPYPLMVRTFQSIIGTETKEQILEKTGKLPNHLVACVGGGSNAIGFFHPFYNDRSVLMTGVEPGGKGKSIGTHAASLNLGCPGIFQGFRSYVLQYEDGKAHPVHSIAPGLDYPSVAPEHSHYKDKKRANYVTVSDEDALDAFSLLSRLEGIIPAIESAHAVAYGCSLAKMLPKDSTIIVNLSGRGDKDLESLKKDLEKSTCSCIA